MYIYRYTKRKNNIIYIHDNIGFKLVFPVSGRENPQEAILLRKHIFHGNYVFRNICGKKTFASHLPLIRNSITIKHTHTYTHTHIYIYIYIYSVQMCTA